MAKKIKFPLEFSNGVKVRTLEELQQYADVESILRYYHNEKLKIWLEARDYNDIVSQILSIDTSDTSYVNKLCNIIGIKFKDVVLPAHLQKGLRTEVEYKGANLDVDVNIINAEKLHKVVQANFIDFIYDSDCRTHKLKDSINSIIPISTIDLFNRSNKLKAIVKNKLGDK